MFAPYMKKVLDCLSRRIFRWIWWLHYQFHATPQSSQVTILAWSNCWIDESDILCVIDAPMIAASGQRIQYKLTASDNVIISTVCRKWPGRFWVTRKIHAGWRFSVNYQSLVEVTDTVTPFHLESLPWRIFHMHDIFFSFTHKSHNWLQCHYV